MSSFGTCGIPEDAVFCFDTKETDCGAGRFLLNMKDAPIPATIITDAAIKRKRWLFDLITELSGFSLFISFEHKLDHLTRRIVSIKQNVCFDIVS